MRRLLPILCISVFLAQPAFASNITNLGALSQQEFRALSEDLGSALSYKPVAPAEPLGPAGFDMGIEFANTDMAKSAPYWSKITDDGAAVTNLTIPKLHVTKGLPLGFDVALSYAKIPAANISAVGAELRYALLRGGTALPAVAIRGAYTMMRGVDQLKLNSKSLDISVSQNVVFLTPYAGIGRVWVISTPQEVPVLQQEGFAQHKLFAGVNLNFIFSNLAMEWDKTGTARSASLKLGFRF